MMRISVMNLYERGGLPKGSMKLVLTAVTILFLFVASASAEPISELPNCSASRTNDTCKLVIDRLSPLSPPTLQAYAGQHIVVIVKGVLRTERYFLDYGTSQATLTPEVITLLTQSLMTPLAKLQISSRQSAEASALELDAQQDVDKLVNSDAGHRSQETSDDNKWSMCNAVLAADKATPSLLEKTRMCAIAILRSAKEYYLEIEPLAFNYTVVDSRYPSVVAPPDFFKGIYENIDKF